MRYEIDLYINDWLKTITIHEDNANEAWEIAKQRKLSDTDRALMIREYSDWSQDSGNKG